jgi:hypothetical protein
MKLFLVLRGLCCLALIVPPFVAGALIGVVVEAAVLGFRCGRQEIDRLLE